MAPRLSRGVPPPLSLPRRWGAVVRVSEQGEALQLLADPSGQRVAFISSTTEQPGGLFFGNVVEGYVSFYPAPELIHQAAAEQGRGSAAAGGEEGTDAQWEGDGGKEAGDVQWESDGGEEAHAGAAEGEAAAGGGAEEEAGDGGSYDTYAQ